ncbi:MAG: M20 family metallopeptidase [Candidatus Peregrinibacteria bacterium]
MKNNLVKLTDELVRFRSVDSAGSLGELKRIVDFVEKRVKRCEGVFVDRLVVKGKPCLIVTFEKNQKKPKVFLNGHLDVVEGKENQFKPVLRSGRLYGRGTHDMKGGCAVMIKLIEEFAKKKVRPDAGFMFVTDEEEFGAQSEEFFKKGYRPELLVTLESTDERIVTETKGIYWMEGEITGKAAHCAYSWNGENPLEDFNKGLSRFFKKFPPLRKNVWRRGFNIGCVQMGDRFNVIPEKLTFKLDVRYLPGEDMKKLTREVKSCFGKNTKWKVRKLEPAHTKAKDMKLIKLLKKSSGLAFGREPYATDARFFAAGGVNSIVFGPRGGGMHSDSEWVDVKSLEKIYEALFEFILRLP